MSRRCHARLRLIALGAGLTMILGAAAAPAIGVVTQSHRMFQPSEIEVARGGTIRFINDDGTLLHHVYLASPSFSFDTGEQGPGKATEVQFTVAGTFTVLCGIHPKMRLAVAVR